MTEQGQPQTIYKISLISLSLPPQNCSNKFTLLFTPTVYIQSKHFLNELLQQLSNIPLPLTTTLDINHSPNYSQSCLSRLKSNVTPMHKITTSSPAHIRDISACIQNLPQFGFRPPLQLYGPWSPTGNEHSRKRISQV